MWLLFCSLALGGEPVENTEEAVAATVIVEAYHDIQVYVAPILVIDKTENTSVETAIDSDSAFTYSGTFWRYAKVPAGVNRWQPVTLGNRKLMLYNSNTIKYVWNDCNYSSKPMECSFRNDHYFLETLVHVDDNQLVVKATLYNSDAQIVTTVTRTDNKIIKWIKQQEVNVSQSSTPIPQQQIQAALPQQNCGTSNCSPLVQVPNTQQQQQVIINKPKEELPLKWEIPHTLTDGLVRQAMLGVWTGVRLEK